jgi:hypothetical protein
MMPALVNLQSCACRPGRHLHSREAGDMQGALPAFLEKPESPQGTLF